MRQTETDEPEMGATRGGVTRLDLPEMPSYNTEKRRSELRRLGLSEPIVRLAIFDPPDCSYRIRCGDVGPPAPEWHDQQPPGPPVSYLWRFRDTVTGVRIGPGWRNLIRFRLGFPKSQLEFIKFKPETPTAGYSIIAFHEQGLLANLFSDLIEDERRLAEIYLSDETPALSHDEIERVRRFSLTRAAECVAFAYYEEIESFHRAHGYRRNYLELLAAYTRSIVAKPTRV